MDVKNSQQTATVSKIATPKTTSVNGCSKPIESINPQTIPSRLGKKSKKKNKAKNRPNHNNNIDIESSVDRSNSNGIHSLTADLQDRLYIDELTDTMDLKAIRKKPDKIETNISADNVTAKLNSNKKKLPPQNGHIGDEPVAITSGTIPPPSCQCTPNQSNHKIEIIPAERRTIDSMTMTSSPPPFDSTSTHTIDNTLNRSDMEPDDGSDIVIHYREYENELQMPDIMRLIQKDLSEPYSIYTYRYFIHNWPKLCFLAMHGDRCVGAIVCKLDMHRMTINRGYIAMLAVDSAFRKLKIGTNLVQKAIQAMLEYNADEVVLETEITNTPALRLYENLGFVRDKRLFDYYLNGVDALRLKLWFR